MPPSLLPQKVEDAFVLSLRDLSELAGHAEFSVTVRNYITGEEFTRYVVEFEHTVTKASMYADAYTGTCYRHNGTCCNGPLSFVGEPVETGRAIPSISQRHSEAVIRRSLHELGEVAYED